MQGEQMRYVGDPPLVFPEGYIRLTEAFDSFEEALIWLICHKPTDMKFLHDAEAWHNCNWEYGVHYIRGDLPWDRKGKWQRSKCSDMLMRKHQCPDSKS